MVIALTVRNHKKAILQRGLRIDFRSVVAPRPLLRDSSGSPTYFACASPQTSFLPLSVSHRAYAFHNYLFRGAFVVENGHWSINRTVIARFLFESTALGNELRQLPMKHPFSLHAYLRPAAVSYLEFCAMKPDIYWYSTPMFV